ncbi:peptide ABC transporter substrate-binding protein [Thalassobaculum sp. OXR-137]|uniref:peptide ABC transporter substrate-binding protein n=1 Tax=Thalassobaculum sp. OXR-137 TaxID=3100173 RepID=UPI002AC90095|nr:peptide ABC transporter substrate-binding protein [Thalassobaculum sp. OXR-137]WPZ32419.1 peptide ABC transporter substrate-binding protein [Thalassobaculum sp. OXR-137]
MRRRFLLALSAFLLLLPGLAAARDTLTIGVSQYPSTLNPMIDAMLAKSYVLAATQRQLTIEGHDWETVCQLCVKLPSLEEGDAETFPSKTEEGEPVTGVRKTYAIRDDAFWADGTPVTTDDVLFAWEMGRNPETGVDTLKAYQDVLDIEVDGPKRFTIVSRKLDYRYRSMGDFAVMPAHLDRPAFAEPKEYRNRTLYQTDPTNPGLWNGPYRVAEVQVGSQIVLARNEHWKGTPPAFDRVVIRAIENTSALEANLLSGSIDMIAGESGLAIDQAIAFEKRHGDAYTVIYQPGLIYEHLDVMLSNPILGDLKVRQALLHAVDREAINNRLFAGKQPVATGSVNPLDWTYTTEGVPTYPYDPAAAEALLEAAGWTPGPGGIRVNAEGQKLSVSLMTTAGNRTRELVQQVLADYWKRVGVETVIRNEPPRVFFGETVSKRRFTGLAMFAWLSAPEHLPRTTLHSESIPTEANNWGGQNYTGYASPEMDRLIDAIQIELDRDKRGALWAEFQRLYATDLPVLPLYFRADSYILPKWLEGVRPTGHKYTTTNWIEEWRVAE